MAQNNEHDIQFKPLTDGLGFHPFADGLPYAPTSKSTTPLTGTGAVAAGRPTFVKPSMPRLSNAPIDPTVARIRQEIENFAKEKEIEKKSTQPSIQTHTPQRAQRHGIGYSLQRFFAYLIDSAFNLSLCATVLSTALLSNDIESFGFFRPSAFLIAGAFLFLCNWGLIAAQEVAFGTSLGKRIFGLRLEGTAAEAFIRAILFIPSIIFSGLGIFMAIFDSRKRCWHDRATQLQPEHY